MGYHTTFCGGFVLDRALTSEHAAYLRKFSETRRMKRDKDKASALPDPIRIAARLDIGDEGSYFVGGAGFRGQENDESVIDHNEPPAGQPSLWCGWTPTDNGRAIMWDGGEKFYGYTEWLRYLIEQFIEPWGYKLNGVVAWEGEWQGDDGIIEVKDNVVGERFDGE